MCGIVGVAGVHDTFTKLYRAAGKLQHRGTDGVGVIFSDGNNFVPPAPHRVLGEAPQSQNSWPGERPENAHLGLIHIRYGTSGDRKNIANTQPFLVDSPYYGAFCLAHNGDTQDEDALRENLNERGISLQSDSDSEALAYLIALCKKKTLPEAVVAALENVKSAFALVLATPKMLIAARDPRGFRPLSIGRCMDGGYIVASETCAFEVIGAEYIRDVAPGEVAVIDENGPRTMAFFAPVLHRAKCVFEAVYFSDPASHTFGSEASMFRHRLGRKLAEEYIAHRGAPVPKDTVIIPVPNSAYHYAEGFSHALWHPLTFPISRINRSARSFIGADQEDRILRVLLKSNFGAWSIGGKDCIIIDDSLVRGNTTRAVVNLFRKHGARRISVLSGSPPILYPCRYGIDFKKESELLTRKNDCDLDAMRADIGADELFYPTLAGFYEVVKRTYGATEDFCFACFNGEYAL